MHHLRLLPALHEAAGPLNSELKATALKVNLFGSLSATERATAPNAPA